MSKLKLRLCPLCKGSKSEKLYSQKFIGGFQHEIGCCKNCGFVFVLNAPKLSFYNKYYRDSSSYELERDHEYHRVYLSIIKKFIDKSAQVIDIGCSTGHLLWLLKKTGYHNLDGIDPSPACQEIARKKYQIEINTANLYRFYPDKKYDLVILTSVIEHLRDVKTAINIVNLILKSDGFVFIVVPDAGRFYENVEEPFGEFSTEHINFFSRGYLYQFMRNFSCKYFESDGKAIYSLWQKGSEVGRSVDLYIKASQQRLEKIKKLIHELPAQVIVWGVGSLTRRLLTASDLKAKTLFFVDNNQHLWGAKLADKDIFKPDELFKHREPVLISSFKFKNEILSWIQSKGLSNKVFSF